MRAARGRPERSQRRRRRRCRVEDEEIRAVYVSCPIHLHRGAFICTLAEKRPSPLPPPRSLSVPPSTARPVCTACLLRTVVWVFVCEPCTGSSMRQIQQLWTGLMWTCTAAHHSNIIFITLQLERSDSVQRCRKNKQAVTSSCVTEGFILRSGSSGGKFHLWLLDTNCQTSTSE